MKNKILKPREENNMLKESIWRDASSFRPFNIHTNMECIFLKTNNGAFKKAAFLQAVSTLYKECKGNKAVSLLTVR